jgi:hypothetical protein
MIDEAFLQLQHIVEKLTDLDGEFYDDSEMIHMYINEFEIESPVEFDILVDENGKVQIGTTPPLYRVDTTIRPSFHRIWLKAEKTDLKNGIR